MRGQKKRKGREEVGGECRDTCRQGGRDESFDRGSGKSLINQITVLYKLRNDNLVMFT